MDQALRTPSFAETYERVLVPSIFGPWAGELIDRARPIGPAERILDLGCGTGVVARRLRERLGGAARISGLDANADMLAMARTLAPELDWHEGNAMKLPFGDASFELVYILPTSSPSGSAFVPLPAFSTGSRVTTPGAPDDEIAPVQGRGTQSPGPQPVPGQQPAPADPTPPAGTGNSSGVVVPVVPVVPVTTAPPTTPPPTGRGGGGAGSQ